MPLVWPCRAVEPHSRVSGAPKAQGLTAQAGDRTAIRRAEMMSERSQTGVPVAGHSLDLPEVTAFSSRFDASDRRRIGEVGAGRSVVPGVEPYNSVVRAPVETTPRPAITRNDAPAVGTRDGGSSS